MNVQDFLIAILGGGNILLFVKFLIERYDQKKDSPERMTLRALAEDRLDVLLHDWLHNDVRLADDWRIIENMYEGYSALGGNGEIKKLYTEAGELRTTE